ncbi:MAG: transglutaminase-like domain-containing protein, partial [Candidatus Dormibacteria bacterium]
MAELVLPLLGLLALLGLVAALPSPGSLARLRAAGTPRDESAAAGLVSLGLAVALVLFSADIVAVTVLSQQTGFVLLAALAGVLCAAGASRHLGVRRRALPALFLSGVAVLSLLIYQLARPGDSLDPAQLLVQELQGLDPLQLQYLTLILVCWLMGAWVGWCAIAERTGLVAAGVPLVVLVSDLINSPPATQSLPLVQVVLAAIAGVALIGWTHQVRQLPLLRSMPRAGAGLHHLDLGRRLRLVGVMALAVGLVALVLPPANRQNLTAHLFGGSQPGGPPIDYAEAPSGYSTYVVPGGAIAEDGTEVLTYTTNAPSGRTYLQGEVFSEFSSGDWFTDYQTTLLLGPRQTIPYDREHQGLLGQRTVRVTVHYLDSSTSEAPDLLFGGEPALIPGGGSYRVSGEGDASRLQDVEQVAPSTDPGRVLSRGRTLTTYATISSATPAELERAGKDYPRWVRPDATLYGSGAQDQVAAITNMAHVMARGATDPYLMALNIQNSLRHDETYNLNPPPVPAGMWPITYFLEDSHQGYCQYFASAMGAMLRALGIPSRLAGGFDAGLDGTVTRSDAHVWVQAYFPQYGWINFEPTPAAFERNTPGIAPLVPATTGPGLGGRSKGVPHPGVRSVAGQTHHHPARAAQAGPPVLAIALAAIAAALLLLLLLWLWWSFRVETPEQLRARLGLLLSLSRRRPPRTQTLHQLALAAAELDPELAPHLSGLADQAERISFGPPGT